MGATIAGLEQAGMVVRQPDAADGRRSILTLTPAGTTAIRSGRSAIVARVAAVMAESFTPEEIATLDDAGRLLQRLAELL
jgi:DNA-binding MarR family transcriptional regulator